MMEDGKKEYCQIEIMVSYPSVPSTGWVTLTLQNPLF
jgi:hypothetical protein